MTRSTPVMNPDLDEATQEELQPPCELNEYDAPCAHPAAWVAVLACCGGIILMCEEHCKVVAKILASGRTVAHHPCGNFVGSLKPFASLERL